MSVYVILSGPPASGKTTLGPGLAAALELPYLAKDTIKQALIAELGAPDVEASRRLGTAAMRALIAVATECGGGVLDGTWLRGRTRGWVSGFDPLVEVFCRCPQPLLQERFAARSRIRLPGHFDADRTWAELWGEETADPVNGGWPVLEVDTSQPVDVATLAKQVLTATATAD